MALVLRKAVLPRNVTLLKCMKGRPVATASNKKNAAPLTTAVPSRRKKEKMLRLLGHLKMEQAKQVAQVRGRRGSRCLLPIRCCVSCPNLGSQMSSKPRIVARHFSPPRTRPASYDSVFPVKASAFPYFPSFVPCLLQPNISQITSKRAYSKPCGCGCPCPFPCGPCGCAGGCGCLPPPCNTPPRCIQYMTGYYYYPYGFWFCGPYHVTGTCAPVGACGACGPCGSCCGRCAAPCCICPVATAVVTPQPARTKIEPKSNIITSPPMYATKETSPPRTGLAKYFPFNTTAPPSPVTSPTKDTRKSPPPMSPMSSLFCPYSTQSPCHKEATIDESDVSYGSANFSTETRPPYKSVENNSFPSSPLCKIPAFAFTKSISEYERLQKEKENVMHHKRSHQIKSCPTLDVPRMILSREKRDKPKIQPGAFDYSSVPRFRNPYPKMKTMDFKAYES